MKNPKSPAHKKIFMPIKFQFPAHRKKFPAQGIWKTCLFVVKLQTERCILFPLRTFAKRVIIVAAYLYNQSLKNIYNSHL